MIMIGLSKITGMHCIDHLIDHVPIQEITETGYHEAVFEVDTSFLFVGSEDTTDNHQTCSANF